MAEATRIEIGIRPGQTDSRGVSLRRRIRELLGIEVGEIRTRDVYHIVPPLSEKQAQRVAREFAGPVLRRGAVGRIEGCDFDVVVSVGYKPGVTDPVAKSARVAIEDLLGHDLGAAGAVFTSRLYLISGVDLARGERIAKELIANEVVERIQVQTRDEWLAAPPDLSVPRVVDTPIPEVETIDLDIPDGELLELSRERLLSLTLEEMQTIRAFFQSAGDNADRVGAGLGPRPTDVELECLAQTWSEHCKHKIMSATIDYTEGDGGKETIRSLFGTYIKGATRDIDERIRREEGRSWLVSVFHDNAGVIEATPTFHLVYKVETHNSPSALDPYGGAITGIVGVNRDPFGTGLGAELLSNVWGYCFAPPDRKDGLPAGLLHPRRIREGVHQGVIDGGNQSGIPYGRGFEIFEERFLGKPLVYCGTVGRMPVTIAGRPGHVKGARPGDRIVMVGGRIGKDGIHGATFSSAELTEESPVQAVQIGDPITERMMFDFLIEARELGLYTAITDNGAGGLSSSVGEMAEHPGGARLDLARAPLKYQGLAPWEILVSEAQERMTIAVPPEHLEEVLDLARARECEATDLGEFTQDGVLEVLYGEETVAWLPMDFLHNGLPAMHLAARWCDPEELVFPAAQVPVDAAAGGRLLAEFLGRDNLASGEQIARQYDHEVKALTVIKPWTGRFMDVPADATVFQVDHDAWTGYALAEGIFPTYSDTDAWAMAQAGVDQAVRRIIAAGGRPDRVAALDNFCWPDPLPGPTNPDAEYKLAQLVRTCKGLYEICTSYGVPLISGKDSMKNDAVIAGRRISIPPTLLVSAIGIIDDVRDAMTLEPSGAGECVVIIGQTSDELAGSEWAAHSSSATGRVPRCDPEAWAQRYRALAEVMRDGLLRSAHAPGRGGLAYAAFLMARAGGMGIELDLARLPLGGTAGWEARVFGESMGRLIVTCREEDLSTVLSRLVGHPVAEIGRTLEHSVVRLRMGERILVEAELDLLTAAWKRQARGEEKR